MVLARSHRRLRGFHRGMNKNLIAGHKDGTAPMREPSSKEGEEFYTEESEGEGLERDPNSQATEDASGLWRLEGARGNRNDTHSKEMSDSGQVTSSS